MATKAQIKAKLDEQAQEKVEAKAAEEKAEAPKKRGRPAKKAEEKGAQAPAPTAKVKTPKALPKAALEAEMDRITAEMRDGQPKHHVQFRMDRHTWNVFKAAINDESTDGATPEEMLRVYVTSAARHFFAADPLKALAAVKVLETK